MYENTTYDLILDRMLGRVSNKLDKREGSVIWDTHSPTAVELQILYLELQTIIQNGYGDTAERDYLILRCKERGITPFPATNAILEGKFQPATVDVTGKRFNVNELNYVVIKKTADGTYQVQCETLGDVGNQYLGQMIPMDYIAGLKTAELTEVLIPGEDEEETEALRQRYFDSFRAKAFGGNREDYITKANAIPGVGSVKVTPVWNGDIRPANMVPNEKVAAWYGSIISTLDDGVGGWLSNIYQAAGEGKLTVGGTVLLTILNSSFGVASDTLIQTVKNTFDPESGAGEGYGLSPIGHVVTVKSVKGVEITVKTTITFDSGYGWSNLQNTINKIVDDHLLDLRKSWSDAPYLVVRVSQIESHILGVVGVIDVGGTLINGVSDNLTLDPTEVPIFEGVLGNG